VLVVMRVNVRFLLGIVNGLWVVISLNGWRRRSTVSISGGLRRVRNLLGRVVIDVG